MGVLRQPVRHEPVVAAPVAAPFADAFATLTPAAPLGPASVPVARSAVHAASTNGAGASAVLLRPPAAAASAAAAAGGGRAPAGSDAHSWAAAAAVVAAAPAGGVRPLAAPLASSTRAAAGAAAEQPAASAAAPTSPVQAAPYSVHPHVPAPLTPVSLPQQLPLSELLMLEVGATYFASPIQHALRFTPPSPGFQICPYCSQRLITVLTAPLLALPFTSLPRLTHSRRPLLLWIRGRRQRAPRPRHWERKRQLSLHQMRLQCCTRVGQSACRAERGWRRPQ